MNDKPKYYTDNWTSEQWKQHKAHGIAMELYGFEKYGRCDWWALPKDDSLSVNVHVTLMSDATVIEYVQAAGYVWDGKEWNHDSE